jgi:uncharacterized membrane protein
MKKLTRLEKVGLGVFIAWFVLGFITTILQVTSGEVVNWATTRGYAPDSFVIKFVLICLKYGDAVLMLLAAINTYWAICNNWGISIARRWTLIILIMSALIETIGTRTGFPFGAYTYTEYFGPRILNVLPLAIPLAWFVVLTNMVLLVREIYPMLLAWQEGLLVASLTAIFDLIMEPFARIKAYWLWAEIQPPWQNYLSWWVISFVLVFLFAPGTMPLKEREIRPLVFLGSMILLFVTARFVHGI